jgi:hypothetical protein
MRHNPYGAAVAANPARVRLPAAGDDPRHGALFGAAFAVGVATRAAAAGVSHLVMAAPTGRFGLVDEAGGRTPLQAVHAELAAASGGECYGVTSGHDGVSALAYRLGDLIRILVANLTPNDVALSVAHDVQSVETIDQAGALSRSRFEPRLRPYRTIVLSVAMPGD